MSFTRADLDRLSAIMAEAAETEIMPRFRSLEDGGIREKTGALDLVTDADEQAEWMIRDPCAKAFPNALFVGEELVARDEALLDKIGGADLAIIVDPVDGTSNFAWGLPLFGVMAAVVTKGETVAGLIYDPVGRDWHKGLKGHGAWGESASGQHPRPARREARHAVRDDRPLLLVPDAGAAALAHRRQSRQDQGLLQLSLRGL